MEDRDKSRKIASDLYLSMLYKIVDSVDKISYPSFRSKVRQMLPDVNKFPIAADVQISQKSEERSELAKQRKFAVDLSSSVVAQGQEEVKYCIEP